MKGVQENPFFIIWEYPCLAVFQMQYSISAQCRFWSNKKKIEYIAGSQDISRRLRFGKHSELITMSWILETVVGTLDNTTLNQAFYGNKKRANSGILYF